MRQPAERAGTGGRALSPRALTLAGWLAVALLAAPLVAFADGISDLQDVYIKGAFAPAFVPPRPGTYELPAITRVPAFVLRDTAGRRVSTQAVMAGRVAVVSFMYTACSDRLGCPLAGTVLRDLQSRFRRDGLQGRAVLVSISFDPEHDAPAHLAKYARRFGATPSLWRFLAPPSEHALQAMLESYGQDRVRVYDERGRFTGQYRHVLKVFLVDPEGYVRNIYSAGFLVPEVVVNDVKTVLAARTAVPAQPR